MLHQFGTASFSQLLFFSLTGIGAGIFFAPLGAVCVKKERRFS